MRKMAGILAAVVVAGAYWTVAHGADGGSGAAAPFKLQIAADTTRIDGPVLADGTIDYNAALWRKVSEGVTEANNAGPLLAKAAAQWKDYVPAKSGPASSDIFAQEEQAAGGPWKAPEHPQMAAWLKENEGALKLVIQASERTRLCPPKPAPGTYPGPREYQMISMRTEAKALVIRAMERVGEGDQEGARADILTVRRLARLMAGVPDLLGSMAAMSLEGNLREAQLAITRASDAKEASEWLKQRVGMQSLQMDAAAIDVGMRYHDLELVMLIIQGKSQDVLGALTLMDVAPLFTGKGANAKMPPGDLAQVDWNIVLRHINAVEDQAAAIVKEKDPRTRVADAERFQKEREDEQSPGNFLENAMGAAMLDSTPATLDEHLQKHQDDLMQHVQDFLKRGAEETPQAYSARMAGMFTHMDSAVGFHIRKATENEVQDGVFTAAMAIEVYKAQHGEYPGTLAALVPGVLKEVPADLFTGKELVYRRMGAGYIVYSVGANGVDDGGETGDGKDDLAVRSADQGSTSAAGSSRDSPAPR